MLQDNEPKNKSPWNKQKTELWLKYFLLFLFVGFLLYKFSVTSIDLTNFDFSDLLSLILAIFSIGLSVMFYLKAEETANRFYDNTYKFTQDISIILGRIESGFGERLRHLDEVYNKFGDYYLASKPDNNAKAENSKDEEETKKVEKQEQKRIQQLMQKTQLQETEKSEILNRLKESYLEAEKYRKELQRLREFQQQSMRLPRDERDSLEHRVLSFFLQAYTSILDTYDTEISPEDFQYNFKKLAALASPSWTKDLYRLGWVNSEGNLTEEGILRLRNALRGLKH